MPRTSKPDTLSIRVEKRHFLKTECLYFIKWRVVLATFFLIVMVLQPFQTAASSSQVLRAQQSNIVLPEFKWPWHPSDNGKIKWSSGPHSWSKGGQLKAKVSAKRANGLDFAKNGESFNVYSMASGTVIRNRCGFEGLGCIVAIKHNIGGSVMIYAHLKPNATNTAPLNDLEEQKSYPVAKKIGESGQSGEQSNIHLHIELRDGATSCYAPADSVNGNDCGDVGFAGNPVGWDGRQLVDGYYISGYFDSKKECGPGADCDTIFNYDGSAVKGSILAPYINFPYIDIDEKRDVLAFVHPSFIDDGVCTSSINCEINKPHTAFAGQGKFSGGGGYLRSTNGPIDSPIEPPISPGHDSSRFVQDVSIPDGFVAPANAPLIKTWRLRNTGTTTWGSGYQLVFIRGKQMGGPSAVSVAVTGSGQEANISVNLTAPTTPGNHRGYWRMRNPQGTYFGDEIWVDIRVPDNTTSPPQNSDITLRCTNCPSEVAPGTTFRPTVVATVNRGQLLQSRGDMLLHKSGERYGAYRHVEVIGSVNQGGSYSFTFYADNPIRAPQENGTYHTTWQVWRDGGWAGEELTIEFKVRSGGGGNNHRPNRPSPQSPHDWYMYYSGNKATLCGRSNGDPDGDAVTHYYFQIYESAQLWNSGWTTSSCATTSSLGSYTYKWRVKVRDSRGLESEWSESRHFTIANPNLSITSLYVEPLDSKAEKVRIRACTEGQGGVGITMRVSVNTANDGSANGTWKELKRLSVPCFNEIDAPVWNTLGYESGPHRIRVEAHGSGTGWNGAAVREMTYNVRSDHRPNRPSMLKPDYQTWHDSRTIHFEWQKSLRTTSYRLQASTSSEFSTLILDQALGANTTSYTHTFSDTYSTVHWRVVAYGPHGQNSETSRLHMDTSPPTSAVATLPPTVSNATFTVHWNGSDVGSGIRWYHVQVRDGNRVDSQWEDWYAQTTLKSADFIGQPGHTYYFRVRAMDKIGQWESWPDAADGDTSTQIDASASTTGTPDLAVVSLETYLDPDGGMLVQVVFENQGDTVTQNGFYTDLYGDHRPDGSGDFEGSLRFWINDPVAAGARVSLTTRVDDAATLAALGNPRLALAPLSPASEIRSTFYAQVDSAGVVGEPDKDNNISMGTEVCLAAADPYEGDDDSHTNAPYIDVEERQLRNFDRPNDEDWVRFYAWEGITYVPHTYGLGENADTYLYLYAADGTTLLASNDDAGSLASQLTWTAPATGHYYLRIRQWNPQSGGCGTQYMLGLLPLQVSSELSLTPQRPMVGETVTATVTLYSTAPAPITLTRIGVGAQGPDCTDWSCGRPHDFPWQREITIAPSITYTYQMQHVFMQEGANYLGQLIYALSDTDWHPTGPTIKFHVGPGLAMDSGLTLQPATPIAGEIVTGSYRVRNNGSRPLMLRYLGLVARGPDCSSWECPWNDFPHEENVLLQPGATFTYSAERSFYDVGDGYFAEPAFGDFNDWWFPVPGSARENFRITPGITLVDALHLDPAQPQAGENVVARFKIRNDSTRPLTLQRLGIGVHGPDCVDWECGRPHDFPWLHGITIQPGAVYAYEQQRTFAKPGDGYFAQIIYGLYEHDWPKSGEIYRFSVETGIEVESALTLSTRMPAVGTPVTATFTIHNAGLRPVELPYIRAVSRGPDCTDWHCANARDFPYEEGIVLAPGERHSYSQQQVFQQAGRGYFAEAAYGDKNGWWMPLFDSQPVEFVVTHGISVTQGLSLSPSTPVVGEIVTVTFAIRNDAAQTVTIRRLAATVQGPDCQDWSCGRPQDFRWVSNIVLEPGEQYVYEEHRPFLASGQNYFGQIIYGLGESDWHPVGERLLFGVQPGLTLTTDLTLSPGAPMVGESVTATYQVRNDGPRPLQLPAIGLVARGPGCTNWECGPILDFPHVEDIVLNPAATYTFQNSRTFITNGAHFAVPAFSDHKGWWYTLPGGAPTNFLVNVEGAGNGVYRSFLPVIINGR